MSHCYFGFLSSLLGSPGLSAADDDCPVMLLMSAASVAGSVIPAMSASSETHSGV